MAQSVFVMLVDDLVSVEISDTMEVGVGKDFLGTVEDVKEAGIGEELADIHGTAVDEGLFLKAFSRWSEKVNDAFQNRLWKANREAINSQREELRKLLS